MVWVRRGTNSLHLWERWKVQAWIFWNPWLGLITVSDWTNAITIADKNLWATTVWNDGDTLTSANCWNYYQWWNNYAFNWISWSNPTTSSTQVNTSAYWPTNYYNSSTFNTNWTPYTWAWDNLWGETTNTLLARKGPVADDYHVPSKDEFMSLVSILASLWITTWPNASIYLKMPYAERRQNTTGAVQDVAYAAYWSSTSTRQDASYNLILESASISGDDVSLKGQWYVIRPFYNRVVSPNEWSWWQSLLTIIDIVVNNPKATLNPRGELWVMLASDLSRFGYIVDPKNKWQNRQTTWYRATSTVYDEFWEWWKYDETWNRIETVKNTQWWYSTMWGSVADCWVWNYTSGTFVYLPKWEERCRWDFEYDIWMWSYWLWAVWNKKFLIFWHRSSENSRQPAWKIYVWDTTNWNWNVSRFGSAYCRYWIVKCYETPTVAKFYFKWTWDNGSSDYWGGYIEVNKNTWEIWTFTSMTQAEVEAIQNAYPTWEYSDLTNMTLLTNLENYSWWAYFNGVKVWNSWYFQRGRDNINQEYIYRPVNLA